MEQPAALLEQLSARVRTYGVDVRTEHMEGDVAGRFDGLRITLNADRDETARLFYLAHSFGSIVEWSTAWEQSLRIFSELRQAKAHRQDQPERLTDAIRGFSAFEEVASEYAVWFLAESGHPDAVTAYTEFFRADHDAMVLFHRTGNAPAFGPFFREWREHVSREGLAIRPYTPRPIPPFRPRQIPEQEVLQR